jgi:hypothetical protein
MPHSVRMPDNPRPGYRVARRANAPTGGRRVKGPQHLWERPRVERHESRPRADPIDRRPPHRPVGATGSRHRTRCTSSSHREKSPLPAGRRRVMSSLVPGCGRGTVLDSAALTAVFKRQAMRLVGDPPEGMAHSSFHLGHGEWLVAR